MTAVPTFQELILRLLGFWSERGCVLAQPYDVETGAGTMNPETFFRVLGPEPWRVAYMEPSRRPADGRYGENPFRLEKHYQCQVILKPSPDDAQELYIDSLRAIGIDPARHDLRFEEDNWEAPTLGAWGVGWQVCLDGLEITQFTYFQQCGGLDLPAVALELTYGMERIAMFLQGKEDVYEIDWGGGISYDRVRREDEYEFSRYYFDEADVEMHRETFRMMEEEAERLLDGAEEAAEGAEGEEGAAGRVRPLVLPAYDCVLRCSHVFNVLDARGALSVTERANLVQRIRRLACRAAEQWVRSGEGGA
jgi:glycyl-tRNA synthetase alpha chain